ncbi:Nn.00g083080.m01.CDS01 [Neocucurbitaria sp. VM-36]
MKAFVFGALLFQTLNAQVSDDTSATPDVPGTDIFDAATPAPLITPGPDAPSEAELLSSEADAGVGVGVDAAATAQVDATASVDAVASAATVVADGLDDLASVISSVVSPEASLPVGTADVIVDVSTLDTSSEAEPTPTLDDFTFPSAEVSAGAGLDAADATATDDFVVGSEPTPDAFASAPDFGANASATAGAGVDAAAASDEPVSPIPDATAGDAEATDLPGDGSGLAGAPPQPGVTTESRTITPNATESVGALADEPVVTPGPVSGGSTGGAVAAQDYNDNGVYIGGDTGDYDGQDYGYNTEEDDEDCPAYCYDSGNETDPGVYSEDDPTDGNGPARRRALGARQEPTSGGFAAFDWPDDEDEEDDDVPDWAKGDSPSSQMYDPKAPCPAKCYRPKPTSPSPRPTLTRTRRPRPTSRPWTRPPPPPPEPTTFATQTRTRRPPPPPPMTSILTSDLDWTGATLAGVCPKTCNPFNPSLNKCDVTTSCTASGGTNYYCACRAGFKASAWNAKDFSKQFHVDGLPYVFVAPGVVCDKPCDDQTCSDVLTRPKCK